MSHRLTADQFVVGLTLNVLVLGMAGYFNGVIDPRARRASIVEIPLLSDIPLIGSALFGQTWPTYLLYPLIPLTWWLLYKTRWGLEVRSVGENPGAADVSGIDVNKRRRQAIYYGGLLAGLGGAFLVLGQVGSFDTSAVGGRGFIAIAAVYFGGWRLGGLRCHRRTTGQQAGRSPAVADCGSTVSGTGHRKGVGQRGTRILQKGGLQESISMDV